jgi:uncharacterized protein YfkK (UPF0435 family)
MIQEGKVLADELSAHKKDALKDTKKFVKKASVSSSKIANAAAKEVRKNTKGKSTK